MKRHTRMTRFAALVAVLLAVSACGARPAGNDGSAAGASSSSSSKPSSAATTSTSSPSTGRAMCFDHVVEAQNLQVDLDGNGSPDDVFVVQAGGTGCGGGLRVQFGQPVSRTQCPDDEKTENGVCVAPQPVSTAITFPPTSLRAVTVPGRVGQVLVVRATHPRGGFQDHLFGYVDGELSELTVDGHALLPFVTTDTVGDPSGGFTATCVDNGIQLVRAVAHQPIGIAPAFDVEETTYTIDGTELRPSATTTLRSNVLGQDLASLYPALARHAVLTQGCG